jgi:hypothetical protein
VDALGRHRRWRLLPPGPAAPGRRCRGDGGSASAGLELGGGDAVLPVANLEPEVAEAALEDGVGAAVEGRRGGPRPGPWPTAPGVGPLAAPCPLQCCAWS